MAHLRLTPLPSFTWISPEPKIFTWNIFLFNCKCCPATLYCQGTLIVSSGASQTLNWCTHKRSHVVLIPTSYIYNVSQQSTLTYWVVRDSQKRHNFIGFYLSGNFYLISCDDETLKSLLIWKSTLGWRTSNVSIRDIFCRALTFFCVDSINRSLKINPAGCVYDWFSLDIRSSHYHQFAHPGLFPLLSFGKV